MFTEGVLATLARSKYRVIQQNELAADVDFSDLDHNDPVLCLFVQEGPFDPIAVACDLALLRETRPSARLVTVRNEKIATLENLLASDADGYIQGSFRPDDLIGILDLIFATSCKLFIHPFEKAVPAHGLHAHKASTEPDDLRKLQRLDLASPPPLSALSKREREILDGLGRGEANKMMARRLAISESTVKAHVRSLLHKLKAENRTQAAMRLLGSEDAIFQNGRNGHLQPHFLE